MTCRPEWLPFSMHLQYTELALKTVYDVLKKLEDHLLEIIIINLIRIRTKKIIF